VNKIYVCRATVAANQNFNEDKPVIVVQEDGTTKYKAHHIKIDGPCEIVYKKESPIEIEEPGMVRCWIETDSKVIRIN
jgi:hypothetical protein|tara:strand:- start:96757 stop:96990 length:234 start_codon:yes stop_codon:yes gene_type:complete